MFANEGGGLSFLHPPLCLNIPSTTAPNQLVTKQYVDQSGIEITTITLEDDNVDNGTVALALDPNTMCYVTNMLDINSFEPLTNGVDGTVTALCVDNHLLYVGGGFSVTDNPTITRLAVWNLTTQSWSSLNAQFTSFTRISTICLHNNILYVGGLFTIAISGGSTTNNLARYDITNSTWMAFGSPNNSVSKVVFYNNRMYIGGTFNAIGTLTGQGALCLVSYILNTNTWAGIGIAGGGSGSSILDMVVNSGSLYAVGNLNGVNYATGGTIVSNTGGVIKLTGNTWTGLGFVDYIPSKVAVYGSTVVVSNVTNAPTPVRTVLSNATGSWVTIGTFPNEVQSMAFDSSGLMLVGGLFSSILNGSSFTYTKRLASWNGTNWSSVGDGIGYFASENALAATAIAIDTITNNAYIGGTFLQSNGANNLTNNVVHFVRGETYPSLYSVSLVINDKLVCSKLLKKQSIAVGVNADGVPYATLVM